MFGQVEGDAQYHLPSVGYFVREKGDVDGRGGANMMYRALDALIDDDKVLHTVVRSATEYSDLRTMHNNKAKYAACILSGTLWYWSTLLLESDARDDGIQGSGRCDDDDDDVDEEDDEEDYLLEHVRHDARPVEPSVFCRISPREFVAAYTGVIGNAMQEKAFVDSVMAKGKDGAENKSRALMVYNTAYSAPRVQSADDVGRESDKLKQCLMLLARVFYPKIPSSGGVNAILMSERRRMFYDCLWRCQSEQNAIAIANTTRADLAYYAVMYFVGPDMLAFLLNEELITQSRLQSRVQWLMNEQVTGSDAIRERLSDEWRKNTAKLIVDGGEKITTLDI